jgi:subfamily B ATP-binding cassette protein MsbA
MNALKSLFRFLKPYRRRFFFALIGMAAFTVLDVLPPLLMRNLMDNVVEPRLWNRLLGAVGLIIIVPVTSHLIRFVNLGMIMTTARRFIADIRLGMYRKILSLSLRYHGEKSSGAIVQRIMDDANMLLRLLTGDTIRLVVDLIIFIFSMTVMFLLSPLIGGVLCGMLFLYYMAYRFFSRRIRSSTQSYRLSYDRIAGRLHETISGVRHVRIYNREEWENTLFLGRTQESLTKEIETRMGSIKLSTVCTAIAGFGSAVIAGLAGYYVLTGRLTYGDFLAINAYVWISINPVTRLTNMAGQMSETFVSVERIAELLEETQDIISKPLAPIMPHVEGAVEFKNVYFQYEANVPLYRGLNLRVDPGMTVALVGPTGCGKTSLTSLMMRYWDIQGGAILIDGLDIRTVELTSLRNIFGVVLQQPVLFDGTLAENIAYSYPEATSKQIEEAARSAEIYDMALNLPNGFDTKIGTEGIKLSVGEKQRVSIARAILKDPSILIMDEATSSLDSDSEALIQKALNRVLKGRTSFIVAHRLSTINSADLIVVMDRGRIIEQGTHWELMQLEDGLYRKLYQELLGENTGETYESRE